MPEKTMSVKCEMNEKNKDTIKRALTDGLGIEYSLWNEDYFQGKVNKEKVMLKMKIDESLASNGYKIHVSVETTDKGAAISCLSLFLRLLKGCLFAVALCLFSSDAMKEMTFFQADGKQSLWRGVLLIAIAIGGFLWGVIDSWLIPEIPENTVWEKLISIEKDLNL